MGWATTKRHWEERSARLLQPCKGMRGTCPSIAPAAPSAQQVEVRFPVPWLPIVRERRQKLARTKNLNALQGEDCAGTVPPPPPSLPPVICHLAETEWRLHSKSQLSRSFLSPLSLGISIILSSLRVSQPKTPPFRTRLQNPKSIQPRKRHRHSRGTRGELLANDSTYVTTTTALL